MARKDINWLTESYALALDECDGIAKAIIEDIGSPAFGEKMVPYHQARKEIERTGLLLALQEKQALLDPIRREQLEQVVGKKVVERATQYAKIAYIRLLNNLGSEVGLGGENETETF